jgi:hypothetical protein
MSREFDSEEAQRLAQAVWSWMIEKRVGVEESWCQSDSVNLALPELGLLIGELIGYPYEEVYGESNA